MRRGGQTEGRGRNRRRGEEGGAAERALRRGVRQSEEVRENRSDGQEVNGRRGRGRREAKGGGGRGLGRGGGEERGRGGRSGVEGGTQGERSRPQEFWRYRDYHSSRETKQNKQKKS